MSMTTRCRIAAVAATLVLVSGAMPVMANDVWEPDNDPVHNNFADSGHPPQSRDLESTGVTPDVDWINVWQRSYRSYEVRLWNTTDGNNIINFERWSYQGVAKLQDGFGSGNENFGSSSKRFLRWQTGLVGLASFGAANSIRIQGPGSVGATESRYTLQYRESTLFCPRFNNAGSQVSVLIIQAAPDGANSCDFSAHFFDESAGTLLGSQTGNLEFSGNGGVFAGMKVYALPTLPALAGQKGAAQIAHTCGYGNLKAKLVALEPATGFSFDTPCTMREQ